MRWVDKMQDALKTRGNKNGINQREKIGKQMTSPWQHAKGTLASRVDSELLALFLKRNKERQDARRVIVRKEKARGKIESHRE